MHLSHNAGSLWTQFLTFLGCKIKLFDGVLLLNYVTISTNNKMRNETPALTGSLAGSKWFFFLHSICLARARTDEHAANLLHQSRHVEIDATGSRPGFRQKSRSVSKAFSKPRTNLSKTWSKTRFSTRFAVGLNNGM